MHSELTAIVTGGSSGLGRAIVKEMALTENMKVFNLSREAPEDGCVLGESFIECDISERDMVRDAYCDIIEDTGKLDRLVNCAGVNYIAPFPDIDDDGWDMVMDTNVKGMFLVTQQFLSMLSARNGTVLNIVSNASHMPMTHSAAYNASKGAAHILTLQMARELTKSHDITVFGLSPAKIAGTGMSRYIEERVPELRGWTPEEAKQYQLNGLLTGCEIPPAIIAEFVTWLLADKSRHFWLSGCVLPYGA